MVLAHTFPHLVPSWILTSSPGCIAAHKVCTVMYPFYKLQPNLNYLPQKALFSLSPTPDTTTLWTRSNSDQSGWLLDHFNSFFILGIVSIRVGWFLFQMLAYLKSPKTWGIVIPYIRRTKSKEVNERVCLIWVTIWHQLSSA